MFTYRATSGWFNTAGYKYDWVKDGYQAEGIGLSKAVGGMGDNIYVVVNEKKYTLNIAKANAFIKKYRPFYTCWKSHTPVELAVISKSLLDFVE